MFILLKKKSYIEFIILINFKIWLLFYLQKIFYYKHAHYSEEIKEINF